MINARNEGLGGCSVLTGDVMPDATLDYRTEAEKRGLVQDGISPPGGYAVATAHWAENTDDAHQA